MQLTQSTPRQRDDAERALRAWACECELFKQCNRLGLRLPEKGWRYILPARGQIVGLPESRGTIRATNGILCAIEQQGGRVYIGHADWFVVDAPLPGASSAVSERSNKRISRIKKEYV